MSKQEIAEKTNTSIELLNRVQLAMRKTWQYMGYEVEYMLEEEGLTVTNRVIAEARKSPKNSCNIKQNLL